MCSRSINVVINRYDSTGFLVSRQPQAVPCGKCPECIKARVNAWLFRFGNELERSCNPLFVTLTYDAEHIPYANVEYDYANMEAELYNPTLKKKDFQTFMKLLRYYHKETGNDKKLKYYACGEYGARRGRPHYHMVLLNLANADLIRKAWKGGRVDIKPMKDGALRYVLKYMAKSKVTNEDKQKEFALVSQGIGTNYLWNDDGSPTAAHEYHMRSAEHCFVRANGIPLAMPKYFKDKIYDEKMRAKVTRHQQRKVDEREKEALRRIKKKFPKLSEKELLNLLELRRLSQKHEKRNDKL